MFQLQQQSSLTYFPNSSNLFPNSLLSFPQTPSLPSQALLFPPVTDLYASLGQLTLTNVDFEPQAQFCEDPNADSRSWIPKQADSIRYDATSSVAALNSIGNNDLMKKSLVNNIIGSLPNQSSPIRQLRCEVCNVVCKTKDVCESHLAGKKHLRNLQEMINPITSIFSETCNTINNVGIMGQTGNVGGQLVFRSSGVENVHELERKRQQLLNAGTPIGSVQMCTICNVACNSHDAFIKHLSGRRHATQAGLIGIDGIGPYLASIRANDQFWNKGKKVTKNKINQPTWCGVCQISCTSTDVFAKHLSGKKHLKNLENLEKYKNSTCYSSPIDTPIATNLIIGTAENPSADGCSSVNVHKSEKMIVQSEALKEDLETKKKVVEGGAAATAVRVCIICNVVCNSPKVFDYHLTGQKHAAMVKKLAE
ncbi:putative C2H2-like zinc finger protein [Hibiscus syriacus]|uniref:C2H2-like zinc finger protein n=1 Tax=Hibiscus syriacus TaxID=106335 RepID=A0A6A3AS32_HIBSY|nr:zinc finger protein 346-like [Hibiscus syriacus]KAE8707434.1 putative C2H2-like zinc finger protein [Hibiscus syriacus]